MNYFATSVFDSENKRIFLVCLKQGRQYIDNVLIYIHLMNFKSTVDFVHQWEGAVKE